MIRSSLSHLHHHHHHHSICWFHSFFSSSCPKKQGIPLLYNSSCQETTTIQLLSWGRGASGQLGSGIEGTRLYPSPFASLQLPISFTLASPIPGQLKPNKVNDGEGVEVGVSCGLFHCGLVVDGKVWMWGKGDGGRLGLGHEDSLFEPALNENLEGVKSVALGGLHSVALNSKGEVFTWGYGGFGALGHTRSPQSRHCELYTWGREEGDGRLGLGPGRGPDQTGGLSIPSKVKALPVPISAVSCGGFFTMALTEEGQLWNWGANSNYELGRGDRIGGWKPQAVPSLKDVRIIQIACGGYHSLALTDEGRVLSWGHGGHGQLGHSTLQSQKVPVPIEALADEKVTYIACGGSSCAAVTDNGKLYMWGNSKDNQLGVPGLPELQPSPVEVDFLHDDDGLGSHNVLQVAVGASHAMCLVSRSSSTN
ncbi:hypothetical protein Leryth_025713 [Lithospermum erythrorhizon]|nr:hypothetical protein Leryth_025713 [Lithospermum erythrorhizon]